MKPSQIGQIVFAVTVVVVVCALVFGKHLFGKTHHAAVALPPAYTQVAYSALGLNNVLESRGFSLASIDFLRLRRTSKGFVVRWQVTESLGRTSSWDVTTHRDGQVYSIRAVGRVLDPKGA